MPEEQEKTIAAEIKQIVSNLNFKIGQAAQMGIKVELEETPMQTMENSFPSMIYTAQISKHL